MKNRRGAAHTDWIISIGLFILYVVFLLIFLKPRFVTQEEPSALLDLVENEFNQRKAVVYKVPIFVNTGDCDGGCAVAEPIPFIPSGLKKSNMALKEGSTYKYFSYSEKKIIFLVGERKKEHLFWLYFSKDFSSYPNPGEAPLGITETTEGVVVDFGATESIEGISQEFIDTFEEEDYYETLKQEIGFPDNKEFSIKITEKSQLTKEYSIGGDPPINADIFVRERHDGILSEEGKREDVVVNIRTW